MRTALFLVLLVFSVVGLSATAAHALEPGCSPDVMLLLQQQADAVRVRNRAYERELISRNESTLGLTCFDQALRLSSRLGYIFSDNVPAAPPPANTVVFKAPLSYPNWGADLVLAKALDTVVSPVFDNQMLNFPPPVGGALPNALTVFVTTVVDPIITAITTWQNDPVQQAKLANIISLINQIDALANSLPTVSSGSLAATIAQINTLTAELNAAIADVISDRNAALGPLLANLKSAIMGGGTAMDCTRIDDLWTAGNPASSFMPTAPVPGDYVAGTPYYSLQDFMNGAVPGAGTVFLAEMANPTNSPILSTALTGLNLLAAPGGLPAWPATPVFPPTATTTDIINQM